MLALKEKFLIVATGGTFDEIHIGHIALLAKAFQVGKKVIIGVSSDKFAANRGKKLNHNFEARIANLKNMIKKEFGNVNYEIAKLDGDFGPAVTTGDVEALVTSSETQSKGKILNEMRAKIGVKPVKVVTVELVKAEDGSTISSTRIRTGEIDRQGRLLPRRRSPKAILHELRPANGEE
ncbi:MAG: pantetheine-phosphate adenylyltransferase [Thermoproteota archaeon]|nr:pantetheine-phosphate adenylyltransferase [Thermoproteota archaeon]